MKIEDPFNFQPPEKLVLILQRRIANKGLNSDMSFVADAYERFVEARRKYIENGETDSYGMIFRGTWSQLELVLFGMDHSHYNHWFEGWRRV